MTERKLELIKYLETLLRLKDFGVKCDDKIKVALDELHKEMGFGNYVTGDIKNITISISKPEDESVEKAVKRIVESMERNSEEIREETYPDTVWIKTATPSSTDEILKNPFDTIK